MGLAEIVTVCMGELIHEMREFLPSVRVTFPGKTIHVYTDHPEEVLAIAEELFVENCVVHEVWDISQEVSLDRVAKHSEYWQPLPILWKLRALSERVGELPEDFRDGVLLVDCDMTFRANLGRNFFADVVLSPFYWGRRDIIMPQDRGGGLLQHRDGEFNAGMLLTRSKEFCAWWTNAYLSGAGGFYEQGCLDMVPGVFTTDYFSPLHNWGKWRFVIPHNAVRSFHQHIGEPSRRMDVGALKISAQRAAARARTVLRSNPSLRA